MNPVKNMIHDERAERCDIKNNPKRHACDCAFTSHLLLIFLWSLLINLMLAEQYLTLLIKVEESKIHDLFGNDGFVLCRHAVFYLCRSLKKLCNTLLVNIN